MSFEIHHAYEFGSFCPNLRLSLLLRNERQAPLTAKLWETLQARIEHSGAGISKDELRNRVWRDAIVEERNR